MQYRCNRIPERVDQMKFCRSEIIVVIVSFTFRHALQLGKLLFERSVFMVSL